MSRELTSQKLRFLNALLLSDMIDDSQKNHIMQRLQDVDEFADEFTSEDRRVTNNLYNEFSGYDPESDAYNHRAK